MRSCQFYKIIKELIVQAVIIDSSSEIILSNDIYSTLTNHSNNYDPPAYYDAQGEIIVLNAKQTYFEIITYLIFKIHNALNKDLRKIEFNDFKNANEYTMEVEKSEFYFTLIPSAKLSYQYLMDHESEARIFFLTNDLYSAYLNIYKASKEITFENYLKINISYTEAYRQQYINYQLEK